MIPTVGNTRLISHLNLPHCSFLLLILVIAMPCSISLQGWIRQKWGTQRFCKFFCEQKLGRALLPACTREYSRYYWQHGAAFEAQATCAMYLMHKNKWSVVRILQQYLAKHILDTVHLEGGIDGWQAWDSIFVPEPSMNGSILIFIKSLFILLAH